MQSQISSSKISSSKIQQINGLSERERLLITSTLPEGFAPRFRVAQLWPLLSVFPCLCPLACSPLTFFSALSLPILLAGPCFLAHSPLAFAPDVFSQACSLQARSPGSVLPWPVPPGPFSLTCSSLICSPQARLSPGPSFPVLFTSGLSPGPFSPGPFSPGPFSPGPFSVPLTLLSPGPFSPGPFS